MNFNRIKAFARVTAALALTCFATPSLSTQYDLSFFFGSAYEWSGSPNNSTGNHYDFGELSNAHLRFDDTLLRAEDFSNPSNRGHREYYAVDVASFYSPFTSLLSFAAGLDLSSLPIRLAEIEYVKYYPMWQPTGRTQAVLNMAYYDGTTAHSSNFVMDFGGVSFGSIEEFFSRTQRVTLQHSFQDAYSAWDEDGYYTYINGYEATMELMSVAPSALAISEPTTVALLGLALTGMAVARRRRVAIN